LSPSCAVAAASDSTRQVSAPRTVYDVSLENQLDQNSSNIQRPLVDWPLAAATGARFVRGGPQVSREQADLVVAELGGLTIEAEGHVRELTGLGHGLPLLPGEVVDRPGWIRAAASGLRILTERALPAERDEVFGPLLAKGAGVQTGFVLAFLASKVLGQYDPFGGVDRSGSLLLVAPNVASAEQSMRVPGRDFRMWVCLHESTHRLQFTAVDWLRDYFSDEVARLVGTVTGDSQGLSDLFGRLPHALSGRGRDEERAPLMELLRSPEQWKVMDRLIALSTLLEGHADYVMDTVGPQVVPSVEVIRRRFTLRRKGGGLLDRTLRSLLGLDAKIRQYAEGAEFTRKVIAEVGMEKFNVIWTSPETLPLKAELTDPASWVRRVRP
jgi:coenzyme F420 biosynthesis associated uncharacterized protein